MGRLRLLGALLLALAIPGTAMAASSLQNVTLAKGDNRTGTYFAWGQTVTIDGDVNGDIVCGAQTVTINGSVTGDVLCGAQTLTINGPVTGSVRSAAQTLTINSNVGRNVSVAVQDLMLGDKGKVEGEVAVAGQTATLNGPVAQSVYAAVQVLDINAKVGGNVTAYYVEQLTLGSDATVAGNLDYTSQKTLTIDKDKVEGKVAYHAPAKSAKQQQTVGDRLGMLLYWVVAALIGALVAVWLTPRMVRSVTNTMINRWSASLGWGALSLLVVPVALFLLALTYLGLPLAGLIGILWVIVLMTSGLFAGVAVGRIAWQRDDSSQKALALSALIGVPIVLIAGWLPWLGFLISLAVAAWAAGGVLLAINRARSLG